MIKKLLLSFFLLIIPTISFAVDGVGIVGGGIGSGSPVIGISPINWTPDIDMVLFFEENTGDIAQDSGAGGQDDFTDVRATKVVRDATFYIQGSKSARSDITDDPFMFCSDATCTGIDFASASEFTIIWWHRYEEIPTAQVFGIYKRLNVTSGYSAYVDGTVSNDPVRCRMDYSGGNMTTTNNSDSGISADTWYHNACIFDDQGTNMVLYPYRNLVINGTTASAAQNYVATTQDPYIADAEGSPYWIDELIVDGVVWTIEELGRQCSIGVAGELGFCDASNTDNYLPCDTNADCGGGVCDTGATAINDPYCIEGTKAGCCMGRNSTYCNGQDLTPCLAAAPN